MKDWEIRRLWSRSRALGFMVLALGLFVVINAIWVVFARPLPWQGTADAVAVGLVFGILITSRMLRAP
jgi:hypothetical protein